MRTDRGAKSATASARQVRYFKRTRTAARLWPWGWLPLFGLAVTFAYGLLVIAPEIEAHTVAEVTRQLNADGVAVRDVKVYGQRVLVRANLSADKKRIRDSARAATCDTWLGKAACPTRVEIEVVAGRDPAVTDTSAAAGPAAASAAARARQKPHRFNFKIRNNTVVLRGEVPDEETRRAIVLEATGLFDEVSDRLTVTRDPPDPSFGWARERALNVLSALHSGQVIWQSRKLSVRGVATARNQVIIRNALTNGADARPGQIHLDPLMTAADCNAQFATLLDGGAVRFERGSSTLLPESTSILERVAQTARECKQQLVIAGHTDSRGRPQTNRDLSRARAESVKAGLIEQGIAGSRLFTRGYGDARPIADNATEAGRAANRRIEIAVMEEAVADSEADTANATTARADSPPPVGAADCGVQFEALLAGNALRFARGSATLAPESAPVLERIAQLARECGQRLVIAGHTDSRGLREDNKELSLARAESVKAGLVAQGVAGERLSTRGYGEARPIADNDTEAGRAANRRIEILTAEGR